MIAFCEDYDRRAKVASGKDADPDTRDYFSFLNRVIDGALAVSCDTLDPPSRVAMREDIACRRGATYSPLYSLSPATYKRYKRRAKYRIAQDLGLI